MRHRRTITARDYGYKHDKEIRKIATWEVRQKYRKKKAKEIINTKTELVLSKRYIFYVGYKEQSE